MKPRTWTKRLTGLFLSVAVFITAWGSMTANAGAAPQADLQLAASSAILVEVSTGKVLYSSNPDQPLPPASMSKMMTEYLVHEAVKQKKINWDDKVPVSEYAFYIAKMPDSSGVYLNMGESHTVKELYKAMAVVSANDATVLLAERIAGSEPNFVAMMNKKAQELGMKNTKFVTSTGLPANELGPYSVKTDQTENLMSARDSAILARALIRDFPEALEISKIPRLTFRAGMPNEMKKPNYNWMLPGLNQYYEGVDGLKTGHTDAARYCFGTAVRGDMRLISVIMGAGSETKRFVETKKLLDYGFSNFKLTKQLDKGVPIKGYETAPVKNGVELTVLSSYKQCGNDSDKNRVREQIHPNRHVPGAHCSIEKRSGNRKGSLCRRGNKRNRLPAARGHGQGWSRPRSWTRSRGRQLDPPVLPQHHPVL